jgi:hypothetical protein
MTKIRPDIRFAVITKIPKDYDGNYATGEILICPNASTSCVAGANIVVNPPEFDESTFGDALVRKCGNTIDLTKKQMVFCLVPVFSLGEILIINSNGRTIPDGRKPGKWNVGCEYFNTIEDAVKRAKEVCP